MILCDPAPVEEPSPGRELLARPECTGHSVKHIDIAVDIRRRAPEGGKLKIALFKQTSHRSLPTLILSLYFPLKPTSFELQYNGTPGITFPSTRSPVACGNLIQL
ncbi:hypothetical protein AV530_019692 [Patagioenas fasciata monilis]|uniref:Uncharacterized protein n=1 Tax=Patagioenas fasciata monilis TaxID=372326 RepID=A0A1V4JEU0_PATFA|nr:hypothetical protein AV530_019692 [Patagioenas fasciata monilis]